MAKRIKITENQLKLLKNIETMDTTKRIKITESQYERLFNKKTEKPLQEDGGIAFEFLTFANEAINFLKELMSNQSQAGLSPFWKQIGVTWGDLITMFSDCGIIATGGYGAVEGGKKVMQIRKKGLIPALKKVYNILIEERYGKNGEIMNQDETVMLGNDMEMSEDYPVGASDDPNAPYNQDDNRGNPKGDEIFSLLKEIDDRSGYTLLFLTDNQQTFVTIYNDKSTMYEDYCGAGTHSGCVLEKLNYLASNDQLEVGECGYDCGSHYIHDLNEDMKNYIMEYHANDEYVRAELGKIFTVGESTMAAGSSGAFEAPMGSQPIKKNLPSSELNEDDIDESTVSGDATGAYVTPKIWAKNPKLSRFSNDPMYPEGEIVAENGEKFKRYVLNLGEVYIIARDDAEAKTESKKLINLINAKFPEADASANGLHQKASFGEEPRQIGENIKKDDGNASSTK